MKKRYYLLANSITYNFPLEVSIHDYTDSKLSDEEILDELNDKCMELEQQHLNTSILSDDDMLVLKLVSKLK